MPHVPVFQHAVGKWRPRWRGRIHGGAVAVTIPAGIILTLVTPSGVARVAVFVYVASLLALFSTSASYHLFTRTQRAQRTMRQLDHAMVYVLIAGTYTPVCLLALPRTIGVVFLIGIWCAALLGIVLKITWRAHKVSGAMYLIIGWAALIILPWAYHRAGFTSLLLFALGGIVYTVGAILFYLQRPQLRPLVFGYHEVWHVFTVVAVALQFAGVGVLIARVG
ncbi:MAG: hemolysin III family protein [Actinomycetota bacterium]|nr:hemolysin III family protein [Actinomycetota bacterium]